MVTFLHLSDLHFACNSSSYNTEEIFLSEFKNIFLNIKEEEKFLLITGDFHNFSETNYCKAFKYIKRIVDCIGIDIDKDVFVIPGNHDVGNNDVLKSLYSKDDSDWEIHNEDAIKGLKNKDNRYLKQRLKAFRAYNYFVKSLNIYSDNVDDDYPSTVHIRTWRNKLNILHLNTALVAKKDEKENQMADVDSAANSDTWEHIDNTNIPTITIGHNNFYDLKEDQRQSLASTFSTRNVSAYLCGDNHKMLKKPEKRRIPISYSPEWVDIPNIVGMKGIADSNDDFSEVGYCIHRWNEETNEVSVEFRTWTVDFFDHTEEANPSVSYIMKRKKEKKPHVNVTKEQDLRIQFNETLNSLHQKFCDFRKIINYNDNSVFEKINQLNIEITDIMQDFYFDYVEGCKYSKKEMSEAAGSFVNAYNEYANAYNEWNSSRSASTAIVAKSKLNDMVDLLLKLKESTKFMNSSNNIDITINACHYAFLKYSATVDITGTGLEKMIGIKELNNEKEKDEWDLPMLQCEIVNKSDHQIIVDCPLIEGKIQLPFGFSDGVSFFSIPLEQRTLPKGGKAVFSIQGELMIFIIRALFENKITTISVKDSYGFNYNVSQEQIKIITDYYKRFCSDLSKLEKQFHSYS